MDSVIVSHANRISMFYNLDSIFTFGLLSNVVLPFILSLFERIVYLCACLAQKDILMSLQHVLDFCIKFWCKLRIGTRLNMS